MASWGSIQRSSHNSSAEAYLGFFGRLVVFLYFQVANSVIIPSVADPDSQNNVKATRTTVNDTDPWTSHFLNSPQKSLTSLPTPVPLRVIAPDDTSATLILHTGVTTIISDSTFTSNGQVETSAIPITQTLASLVPYTSALSNPAQTHSAKSSPLTIPIALGAASGLVAIIFVVSVVSDSRPPISTKGGHSPSQGAKRTPAWSSSPWDTCHEPPYLLDPIYPPSVSCQPLDGCPEHHLDWTTVPRFRLREDEEDAHLHAWDIQCYPSLLKYLRCSDRRPLK
ncbi:hypothetical protein B0H10DRAFT_1957375 [Mycena sp. CBHHK59/15]|nr:hypothetical protein B0H10DRAFT_1957375 [Mycena sp. CBHHK59/15]